jgi:hypothetical protein
VPRRRSRSRTARIALLCLALATAGVTASALVALLTSYPPFVDIEIPLRAADRWLHGGMPYLASSFSAPAGYDLPFLYPPVVLPFLAPLTLLPREVVWGVWLAVVIAAGVFTLRRLGVPWIALPPILAWPPFAEGILGGNVQVLLVAAFVAVYVPDPGSRAGRGPSPRVGRGADARDGTLVALVPTFKITQPHAWFALLRDRPTAAVLGAVVVAGIAAATLPLVGTQLWLDWVDQVKRAADPVWPLAGASLTAGMPAVVGLAVLAATVAATLVAPRTRLAAWVGALTVIGAPSLRMFGILFLLPALVRIRLEIALVAALLIATYTLQGLWAGIAVGLVGLIGAERYRLFQEFPEPEAL